MELSYIFFKIFFVIFRKGIFRTQACLEPKAYPEHCQTSAMDSFAKIATYRTFKPKLNKTVEKRLSYIFSNKAFPMFQETEHS